MATKSYPPSTITTHQVATGTTESGGVNVGLSRLIWVEHPVESFFESNGFIGKEKDMGKIIWKKVDLSKSRGETIYMLMRAKLGDSGITGDSVLMGNEEALAYGYQSITIDQIRHAVALDGAMTEQRFIGDLRADAKDALKVWLAEHLDANLFTTLSASLSRVIYAGDAATTTGTLSTVDKLDLATVAKARALAIKKRIKGVRHKGKEYYVLIMHPEQAYDLQTNAAEAGFSWETLQKDAANRGEGNNLFTGALGLYMGVLFHSHESIATSTTWGSGGDVTGATALFCGAGAGMRAHGGYRDTSSPVKAVEEFWDYKNVFATAIGTIYGDIKTKYTLGGSSSSQFNEDYSLIGIRTARTSIVEGT